VLVALDRLPKHVAIILDGNGRWAQRKGRIRTFGHEEGSTAVRRIVRASRRLGINALTLFAFSEQNWGRPQIEVDALMALLREFLISERTELLESNIKLRAIGRLSRLPKSVTDVLDPLVEETKDLKGMTLTLALSYGGREEIADAAKRIALAAAAGELDPNAVDEAMFTSHLPSLDVGCLDLLIRTGGEKRISNFLIWAAAYAELHFSSKFWPEFEAEDLYEAIAAYQERDRRFGQVATDFYEPHAYLEKAGE